MKTMKLKTNSILAITVMLFGQFISCTDVDNINVSEINLDRNEITIEVGKSVSLTWELIPNNATNKTLLWSSEDKAVATVNEGKITAIKIGTTNIIVTSLNGKISDVCEVKVIAEIVKVEKIEIEDASSTFNLVVGATTVQLNVLFTPENATNRKLNWLSSKPDVASVDTTGMVTPIKAGETKISVNSQEAPFLISTRLVKVLSQPVPVSSVSINEATQSLEVADTFTFTATVLPSNADNPTITWSSDNVSVSIDATGVVTANSVGSANITATAGSITSSPVVVTVNAPAPVVVPVSSVSINESAQSLEVADTFTFTATVLPSNADNPTITWSSDNVSVSIDATGVVTANSVGSANITATAGSITSSPVVVTVSAPAPVVVPVSSVSINESAQSLEVADTFTFTATVLPSNADNPDITWSSDNVSVSIDATGVVTANSVGSANITAMAGSVTSSPVVVTVSAPAPVVVPVSSVSINESAQSLKVADNFTFTATVLPSNADNPAITWSSDNVSVSIDATGVVIANSVGSANITATAGSITSSPVVVTVSAPAPVVVPVSSVSINESAQSLEVADTFTFTATVLPSNADNPAITWSSDNVSVSIDASTGVVIANSVGSANITATAGSITSSPVVVTVSAPAPVVVPVSSVSINESAQSLEVADTFTFTATVLPSNADNPTITWSSDNVSVSIDASTGVVIANSVGSANITAMAGSVTSSPVVVTVNAPAPVVVPVSSVSINESAQSLEVAGTFTFTATVLPSNADNPAITWSSDNVSVSIDASTGVVTANSVGSANITATAGSITSSPVVVTVNAPAPVAVSSVSINEAAQSLEVAVTFTFTATVLPSNADNPAITWLSDNASVSIDASTGVVTANSVGSANITATAGSITSSPVVVTVVFSLTSTTFTDGGEYDSSSGNQLGLISPQLSWTASDNAEVNNFVIVLIDKTANFFVHAVYEVPPTTSDLNQGDIPSNDYIPPSPPGGPHHTYVFRVYAVKSGYGGVGNFGKSHEKILEDNGDVIVSYSNKLSFKYRQR